MRDCETEKGSKCKDDEGSLHNNRLFVIPHPVVAVVVVRELRSLTVLLIMRSLHSSRLLQILHPIERELMGLV